MAVRERVQRAIEGPVDAAAKLVAEAPHADDLTKLWLQLDGWFRGIAAALEELAVELEVLREEAREVADDAIVRPPARTSEPQTEPEAPTRPAVAAAERSAAEDEEALAERARAARADLEAIREEES